MDLVFREINYERPFCVIECFSEYVRVRPKQNAEIIVKDPLPKFSGDYSQVIIRMPRGYNEFFIRLSYAKWNVPISTTTLINVRSTWLRQCKNQLFCWWWKDEESNEYLSSIFRISMEEFRILQKDCWRVTTLRLSDTGISFIIPNEKPLTFGTMKEYGNTYEYAITTPKLSWFCNLIVTLPATHVEFLSRTGGNPILINNRLFIRVTLSCMSFVFKLNHILPIH